MAFHSPFLSKHRPDHRAKECQDRYTFADTFNACVNEWMLRREHALWVTDKLIGTWEAWDCLCACHSCLRTVQGLWFHSQQWLLTDCSQPWALLHGLSHRLNLALQRCLPFLIPTQFSLSASSVLLVPSWKEWSKAINGNSLHAWKLSQETRQKEQSSHCSLEHCDKARNIFPFPRTSP